MARHFTASSSDEISYGTTSLLGVDSEWSVLCTVVADSLTSERVIFSKRDSYADEEFYTAITTGGFLAVTADGQFDIWANNTLTTVNVAAFNSGRPTHISVSDNTNNRVFFGLNNGRVVRVDNDASLDIETLR